jgi:hypothetical protein
LHPADYGGQGKSLLRFFVHMGSPDDPIWTENAVDPLLTHVLVGEPGFHPRIKGMLRRDMGRAASSMLEALCAPAAIIGEKVRPAFGEELTAIQSGRRITQTRIDKTRPLNAI